MTSNDIRTLLQRPIAFHRIFVDVTGSVTAALMLSQAVYWSDKGDDDGWFWKKQAEWEKETGLSRREQDTARLRLRQLGVLEEDLRKMPARLYFRINFDTLYKLVWRKAPNKGARKRQTSLAENAKLYKEAETTSETTSEITSVSPPSSGNGKNGNHEKAQQFYTLLKTGYAQKGKVLTWGAPEWANMHSLLAARPDLTEAEFLTMVRNRFRSKNVNRAERPMFWLTKLPNYEQGPLNEFGRPWVPTDDDRNIHPDKYYPEYNSPQEDD
jgi:hypothetical protein